MLLEIKNDLFNIAIRLKEINKNYRIFWNNRLCRFEVHNGRTPTAFTLCFVVPYAELDERTLIYANKTRIENYDQLEHEVTNHNKTVEQTAQEHLRQSNGLLSDMMNFAANSSQEVIFSKAKKWM